MPPKVLTLAAILSCSLLPAHTQTVGVDVTTEAYSAFQGGASNGSGLHGSALVHGEISSQETSADRPLWSAYLSALAVEGRGPTERYVSDFLAASNLEAYNSVRLYSWWVETNRGPWSVRAGALLADEEFAGTDAGGGLLNSSFGWPVFISANTLNTGPAYYVATLGIRVAYDYDERTTWRLGIYDGDAFDSASGRARPTRHGLHYELGDHQGLFAISEITHLTADNLTRFTAGAWLHTADFDDLTEDDSGQLFVISGAPPKSYDLNYGVYGSLQRTLRGTAGEAGSLAFFLRGGLSPSDRNTIGWAFDTGLGWTGPLPGRPADVLTLGLSHAEFSPDYTRSVELSSPGDPRPDFERVIELAYTITLTEHISLQPDLQYIQHPGGSTAQSDAYLFLLRLNASY